MAAANDAAISKIQVPRLRNGSTPVCTTRMSSTDDCPLIEECSNKHVVLDETKSSIFIVGMRGAGKTTASQWASSILGWPAIDMDDELERTEGMNIRDLLKDNDWQSFRSKELRLLKCIMQDRPRHCIVATGGGIVETAEARELLKDWTKEGIVLLVSRDTESVMDYLRMDKSRPAYVEDPKAVYLRRKPWLEEVSNLHFHSTAVLQSNVAAGRNSAPYCFERFLRAMTGCCGALSQLRSKKHSFSVTLTAPRIDTIVHLLPEIITGVDAIELRADLLIDPNSSDGFATPDFLTHQVALIRASTMLPLIFALRTTSQGGRFPDNNWSGALALYRVAFRMGFDVIDIELTAAQRLRNLVLRYHEMCVIMSSYHDTAGALSWRDGGAD